MKRLPLEVLRQLVECEKYQEAIPLLDEFLGYDQGSLPALQLMARCLDGVGRLNEAVLAWQMCVLVDPEPSQSQISLSLSLWKVGQRKEAMDGLTLALHDAPDRVEVHVCHARFLCKSGRFEESLLAADVAVGLDPESPHALYARARALRCLGRHEEAEAAFSITAAKAPSWPKPKFKAAIQRFILGRFEDGIADYEQRWLIDEAPRRIKLSCPEWNGEEFSGSMLVYGEQGIGDEIFFMGLLSLLGFASGSLVLAVDSRLVSLFTRSFPDVLVLARDSVSASFPIVQRTLPAASLLSVLVRSGIRFPRVLPAFLKAPDRLDLIRSAALNRGIQRGPRIGLCWRSAHPVVASEKSIDLACLDFLTDWPDSELVALQHGDVDAEIEDFAVRTSKSMVRPGFDTFTEIDLLASLIAGCDCVVTIPGIVAHLAGALGVPAIVLSRSPLGRVWYWEGPEGPSQWYDSVRVFRGRGDGDLSTLLSCAKTQLLDWFGPG